MGLLWCPRSFVEMYALATLDAPWYSVRTAPPPWHGLKWLQQCHSRVNPTPKCASVIQTWKCSIFIWSKTKYMISMAWGLMAWTVEREQTILCPTSIFGLCLTVWNRYEELFAYMWNRVLHKMQCSTKKLYHYLLHEKQGDQIPILDYIYP